MAAATTRTIEMYDFFKITGILVQFALLLGYCGGHFIEIESQFAQLIVRINFERTLCNSVFSSSTPIESSLMGFMRKDARRRLAIVSRTRIIPKTTNILE